MPIATLAIKGPVTLAEVASWRVEILRAFDREGDLRADLAGSGPWDLAGVQLLASALATAARRGRAFRLSGVPEVLATALDRAGLAGAFSGHLDDPRD